MFPKPYFLCWMVIGKGNLLRLNSTPSSKVGLGTPSLPRLLARGPLRRSIPTGGNPIASFPQQNFRGLNFAGG